MTIDRLALMKEMAKAENDRVRKTWGYTPHTEEQKAKQSAIVKKGRPTKTAKVHPWRKCVVENSPK